MSSSVHSGNLPLLRIASLAATSATTGVSSVIHPPPRRQTETNVPRLVGRAHGRRCVVTRCDATSGTFLARARHEHVQMSFTLVLSLRLQIQFDNPTSYTLMDIFLAYIPSTTIHRTIWHYVYFSLKTYELLKYNTVCKISGFQAFQTVTSYKE